MGLRQAVAPHFKYSLSDAIAVPLFNGDAKRGRGMPHTPTIILAASALLLVQANTRAENRACRKRRKAAVAYLADESARTLAARDDPRLRELAIGWLVRQCHACGRCRKPLKAPHTPA